MKTTIWKIEHIRLHLLNLCRNCLAIILILFACEGHTQQHHKYKVWNQSHNSSEVIYVSNNTSAYLTVVIEFTQMENVWFKRPLLSPYLIPPNTKDSVLCIIEQIDKSIAWKYNYDYEAFVGDYRFSYITYDKNLFYTLPFSLDSCFSVSNIYDHGSHKGNKAIDFKMPIGTPITAMRPGIITDLHQSSDKGCKKSRCANMANYILIQHSDYTVAEYYHLMKEGANVNVGDSVNVGDIIGYSGNTGYSRGPHLHIAIYQPTAEGKKFMDINFYTLPTGHIEGSKLKIGDILCNSGQN